MTVELPEWQPFSGDDAPWTPEPTERGRVVVALAPPPSSREQWSANIVLDMLDRWGESGHRVVLADCVLEHPTLHRSAGLPNDEGLADAALFGASVSRVARPVPGRSFFFVSAGSPVGDAETVLHGARLGRLQQGFRDAGVTFVAFVRQGCVGVTALLDAADDVVVLARDGESAAAHAHDAADRVRVVVGPPAPPVEDVPDALGAAPDEPDQLAAWDAPEPVEEAGAWDVPLTDVGGEETVAPEAEALVTGEVPMDFTVPQEPGDTDDAGDGLAAASFEGLGGESGDDPAGDSADDLAAEPAGGQAEDASDGVYRPGAEVDTAPAAPVRTRRAHRGSDPNARRKLLWVALAVLVLVALVVLGALG